MPPTRAALASSAPALLAGLRRTAARLLLGPRCEHCGAVHIPDTPAPLRAARLLCPACREILAPRMHGYCPGCGALHGPADPAVTLCGACRDTPRPWGRLFFYGEYKDDLRDLLLAFKYGQSMHTTHLLQSMALDALDKADGQDGGDGCGPYDAVVPIPLHPARLTWRGFNQSVELARPLARSLGAPLATDLLARLRPTVPQASLPFRERMDNLKGAFGTRKADAGGTREIVLRKASLLLVDDILTTGATLEEAARTLRRAGAARVDVLVLARTGNDG